MVCGENVSTDGVCPVGASNGNTVFVFAMCAKPARGALFVWECFPPHACVSMNYYDYFVCHPNMNHFFFVSKFLETMYH